jgi:endonuclease IV
MSLNYEAEFYRDGLLKTVSIKEQNKGASYETIEFTIKNKLTDDNGKVIIDTGHTSFFSPKEFREFFGPIFKHMKERLDNDIPNSIQE